MYENLSHEYPLKRVIIKYRSGNPDSVYWASSSYQIDNQLDETSPTVRFYALEVANLPIDWPLMDRSRVTHRYNVAIPKDAIESIEEEYTTAQDHIMALFSDDDGNQYVLMEEE